MVYFTRMCDCVNERTHRQCTVLWSPLVYLVLINCDKKRVGTLKWYEAETKKRMHKNKEACIYIFTVHDCQL